MKKFVGIILILTIILSLPIKTLYCNDNLMPIMGQGKLDPEDMCEYLLQGNDPNGLNPVSAEYAKEFVAATVNMANAEGVNYDVVFALMMHETGFLNYGGDVIPVQNNFGGLGTTGGGVQGAYFENAEEGVLAVVQHLKCYASTEPCNLEVVDPRWSDELRGKAEYVQYLGVSDNPNGTGWAYPGEGYGDRLIEKINEIASLDASPSEPAQYENTQKPENPSYLTDLSEAKKIELTIAGLLIAAALFIVFAIAKTKSTSLR